MANEEPKEKTTADLLWDLLRSVQKISHPVKKGEVTVQQFILLKTLNWHGEQTVGELARRVGLTQSSVSIAIKRLEKECLVSRERDPADERRVSLALTGTGRAVLQNWQEKWTQTMDSFLHRLDAREDNQLHVLLQKILGLDNSPKETDN